MEKDLEKKAVQFASSKKSRFRQSVVKKTRKRKPSQFAKWNDVIQFLFNEKGLHKKDILEFLFLESKELKEKYDSRKATAYALLCKYINKNIKTIDSRTAISPIKDTKEVEPEIEPSKPLITPEMAEILKDLR